MGELWGPLIFVIIMAASWVFQARKERVEREQARELANKHKQSHADLPEETRRQLFGETAPREAQRKGTARPSPESTGPPVAPGSDLFEALFGETKPRGQREDEEGWAPVEPARRRELPQQRPAQPVRRPATSTSHEAAPPPLPVGGRNLSVEDLRNQRRAAARQQETARQLKQQRRAQAEREQALKNKQEEWERRRRKATKPTRRRAPSPAETGMTHRKRGASKGILFGSASDVRRAIVLSEVLAAPKGLQEHVEPKLYCD